MWPNREWMYTMRTTSKGFFSPKCQKYVNYFLDFAFANATNIQRQTIEGLEIFLIRCLCSTCKNLRFKTRAEVQVHLYSKGFVDDYKIIAQLLSERLIPFAALDVRSDRVSMGHALDLPVYFGDAGSREVLHKIGAHRACAAAITLDSPGANYRAVWALNKYFPNVKTFVRPHDVDHGLNLEKAGATAVVPETLEPSLQLASAVLAQAKLPMSEIAAAINEFRSRHLSELTELSETSGSSLGYGFSRIMSKPKSSSDSSSDDNQISEGTLAI